MCFMSYPSSSTYCDVKKDGMCVLCVRAQLHVRGEYACFKIKAISMIVLLMLFHEEQTQNFIFSALKI